jgi:hypothetical protein
MRLQASMPHRLPSTHPSATATRFGSAPSTPKKIPLHELLDLQPDFKPVVPLIQSDSPNKTKAVLLVTAIWLAQSLRENGWGPGFKLPTYMDLKTQEWKIKEPLKVRDFYESERYLGDLGILKVQDSAFDASEVLRLPTQNDIDVLTEKLGRLTGATSPATATPGLQETVKLEGIAVKPQTLMNLLAQAQKAGSTIGALLDRLFENPPQA